MSSSFPETLSEKWANQEVADYYNLRCNEETIERDFIFNIPYPVLPSPMPTLLLDQDLDEEQQEYQSQEEEYYHQEKEQEQEEPAKKKTKSRNIL